MELSDALAQIELTDEEGTKVGDVLELVRRLVKFYTDNGRNERPDPALEELLDAACL